MLFSLKPNGGLALSLSLVAASIVYSGIQSPVYADAGAVSGRATKKEDPYRLPRTVVPAAYELTFEPNLKDFSFKGFGKIVLTVKKQTSTIVLNALDLEIDEAKLQGGESQKSINGRVKLDSRQERAEIRFSEPVKPGTYDLNLRFTGTLNDKLRGFYRSHYKDAQGNKHWLATTQMEPTDARRMFPCFDEPDMKSTFKLSVVIDPALTAISNGRVLKEQIDEKTGKKTVLFEKSPRMSTYLVALMVGNFKPTQTKTACGVPVRVWALEGNQHLANYALEETCKVLEYQTDYFGIPYPSNKLDLIAIPDFRSGAMENLGAITFREARLLVDGKKGSNFTKRGVVAVIAHELAHQWFGDLVTMEWWDDLWLNEAFASWMGTKTVEAIHPEFRELASAILTRNGSMEIDQLKATRAIHSAVLNPKQAAEMFDGITYDKGESILWMLEGFVGEKNFRSGIRNYLKANKFGNATSEDLWKSIGEASKRPVPKIMKTWIFQPGFPLVTVRKGKNTGALALSQKRFFGLPGKQVDNQTWSIPIVVRGLQGKKKQSLSSHLLQEKDGSFVVPSEWGATIVNAGGRGYFRALYAAEDRARILDRFDQLSPEERLAFLSDVKALDKKGLMPVEDRLALLSKIAGEDDPMVQNYLLRTAYHPFYYLDDNEKPAYEKMIQVILEPIKKKVGWQAKKGEEFNVKRLRSSLLRLLGTFARHKATISEARDLYQKYLKDRDSISADIATTVLAIVAYNGADSEYDAILEAYKKERVPEHENRLLYALAEFQKPSLVDRTLAMSLGSDVRAQDGFRLLAHLMYGHQTNTRAWQFIKKNWDKVTRRFPGRTMSYIASACSSFDRPDEEKDLKDFFADHDLPYARSSVSRMLERVHGKVLYRKRNEEKIKKWVVKEAEKLKVM